MPWQNSPEGPSLSHLVKLLGDIEPPSPYYVVIFISEPYLPLYCLRGLRMTPDKKALKKDLKIVALCT